MFCVNCGRQIGDKDVFCPYCGAKTKEIPKKSTGNGEKTITIPALPDMASLKEKWANRTPKQTMIWLCGAAVIFILLICLIGGTTTPAYEKPVQYLAKGVNTGNFSYIKKALPVQYYEDDMRTMFLETSAEEANKMLKEMNMSVKIKVMDKEKLSHSELKDIEEDMGWYFEDEVKIEAGYCLDVRMSGKRGGESYSNRGEITVIKIGGKWYLNPDDLGL